MNIDPIRLKTDDLFDLDLFFKKQYTGQSRYGTMGSFYWKIFKNPHMEGFVNLIKDRSKIVACTSITPKSLLVNNKLIPAAEIGDTYTDIEYQGKGLFSTLINQSREEANELGIKFVYGTPNNQSLPGYQKRANFDVVESIDVRSLRFQVIVDKVLRKKGGWFLANLGNLAFGFFVRVYNTWLNLKSPLESFIIVEEKLELPPDWNNFWAKASAEWDFIFNKDFDSMFWRYMQSPDKYKLLVLRSNLDMVGFCVCRFVSDVSGTNIVISDFLTLREHSESLKSAIRHLISLGLEKEVKSISLWCEAKSPYFLVFRSSGFLNVSSIPLITHKDAFLEHLKSIERPHFVMGDSDNI
ncbi:MAG: GNAT family N-acetyltransferase [Cyclobacteriaceae bacterium]|nr:GNAT family N-acetyltransferase [Cyclobacteriaceae bacterium]